MKGLKKLVLVSAIAAAPLAAQAELKAVDDAVLADVSGQSGLVIEAGFGSMTHAGDYINGVDWSNAGITIEAFKWTVDAEEWDSATNDVTGNILNDAAGDRVTGGFIAKGIAIAGAADMTIDAVGDLSQIPAGNIPGAGGIGITFGGQGTATSVINFRVAEMGTFVDPLADAGGAGTQLNSFGGIEIIGMDISGLELVVRGN